MSNGWTPARKARQSVAVQSWKPWLMATGPKTKQGKAKVSQNAFKGARRPALRQEMTRLRAALRIFRIHESFPDHQIGSASD